MVTFSEDGLAGMRASSMALANEALTHFIVLVGFVTTLGEANSG